MSSALPPGWEKVVDGQGRTFFVNHNTRETSWNPPTVSELPTGWEERRDEQGRVYFIDHATKSTSWIDPRNLVSNTAAAMADPGATPRLSTSSVRSNTSSNGSARSASASPRPGPGPMAGVKTVPDMANMPLMRPSTKTPLIRPLGKKGGAQTNRSSTASTRSISSSSNASARSASGSNASPAKANPLLTSTTDMPLMRAKPSKNSRSSIGVSASPARSPAGKASPPRTSPVRQMPVSSAVPSPMPFRSSVASNSVHTLSQTPESSYQVMQDAMPVEHEGDLPLAFIPVMMTDDHRSDCMQCHLKFSAVMRRRHHCRLCGVLYCSDCLMKRVKLPIAGKPYGDKQPVCIRCARNIDADDYISIVALSHLLNYDTSIPAKLQQLRGLGMAFRSGRVEESANLGPHSITQLNDMESVGGVVRFCSLVDLQSSPEVQRETCIMLAYLLALNNASGNETQAALGFEESKVLELLFDLLHSESDDVQVAALRVLYHVAESCQTLLLNTGTSRIYALLQHASSSSSVPLETVRVINRMLTQSNASLLDIGKQGGISHLCTLLETCGEDTVTVELTLEALYKATMSSDTVAETNASQIVYHPTAISSIFKCIHNSNDTVRVLALQLLTLLSVNQHTPHQLLAAMGNTTDPLLNCLKSKNLAERKFILQLLYNCMSSSKVGSDFRQVVLVNEGLGLLVQNLSTAQMDEKTWFFVVRILQLLLNVEAKDEQSSTIIELRDEHSLPSAVVTQLTSPTVTSSVQVGLYQLLSTLVEVDDKTLAFLAVHKEVLSLLFQLLRKNVAPEVKVHTCNIVHRMAAHVAESTIEVDKLWYFPYHTYDVALRDPLLDILKLEATPTNVVLMEKSILALGSLCGALPPSGSLLAETRKMEATPIMLDLRKCVLRHGLPKLLAHLGHFKSSSFSFSILRCISVLGSCDEDRHSLLRACTLQAVTNVLQSRDESNWIFALEVLYDVLAGLQLANHMPALRSPLVGTLTAIVQALRLGSYSLSNAGMHLMAVFTHSGEGRKVLAGCATGVLPPVVAYLKLNKHASNEAVDSTKLVSGAAAVLKTMLEDDTNGYVNVQLAEKHGAHVSLLALLVEDNPSLIYSAVRTLQPFCFKASSQANLCDVSHDIEWEALTTLFLTLEMEKDVQLLGSIVQLWMKLTESSIGQERFLPHVVELESTITFTFLSKLCALSMSNSETQNDSDYDSENSNEIQQFTEQILLHLTTSGPYGSLLWKHLVTSRDFQTASKLFVHVKNEDAVLASLDAILQLIEQEPTIVTVLMSEQTQARLLELLVTSIHSSSPPPSLLTNAVLDVFEQLAIHADEDLLNSFLQKPQFIHAGAYLLLTNEDCTSSILTLWRKCCDGNALAFWAILNDATSTIGEAVILHLVKCISNPKQVQNVVWILSTLEVANCDEKTLSILMLSTQSMISVILSKENYDEDVQEKAIAFFLHFLETSPNAVLDTIDSTDMAAALAQLLQEETQNDIVPQLLKVISIIIDKEQGIFSLTEMQTPTVLELVLEKIPHEFTQSESEMNMGIVTVLNTIATATDIDSRLECFEMEHFLEKVAKFFASCASDLENGTSGIECTRLLCTTLQGFSIVDGPQQLIVENESIRDSILTVVEACTLQYMEESEFEGLLHAALQLLQFHGGLIAKNTFTVFEYCFLTLLKNENASHKVVARICHTLGNLSMDENASATILTSELSTPLCEWLERSTDTILVQEPLLALLFIWSTQSAFNQLQLMDLFGKTLFTSIASFLRQQPETFMLGQQSAIFFLKRCLLLPETQELVMGYQDVLGDSIDELLLQCTENSIVFQPFVERILEVHELLGFVKLKPKTNSENGLSLPETPSIAPPAETSRTVPSSFGYNLKIQKRSTLPPGAPGQEGRSVSVPAHIGTSVVCPHCTLSVQIPTGVDPSTTPCPSCEKPLVKVRRLSFPEVQARTFSCSTCSQMLTMPPGRDVRQVKCPKCGNIVTTPTSPSAEAGAVSKPPSPAPASPSVKPTQSKTQNITCGHCSQALVVNIGLPAVRCPKCNGISKLPNTSDRETVHCSTCSTVLMVAKGTKSFKCVKCNKTNSRV